MSKLKTVLFYGSIIPDAVDSLWDLIKKVPVPQVLKNIMIIFSPLLAGFSGVFSHIGEGIKNISKAIKDYRNAKEGRRTRVATRLGASLLASIGIGFSVMSLSGVEFIAQAFLPIPICGLLPVIYGLALWRKTYLWMIAKNAFQKAAAEYGEWVTYHEQEMADLKRHLHELSLAKSHLSQDEPQLKLAKAEESYLTSRLQNLQQTHDHLKQANDACRVVELKRERLLAFKTVDIFTSALSVTGTVLGISMIVGAGIASVGVLPLAILATAFVASVAVKIFEKIDKRNNHLYTKRMRDWMTTTWENFFPSAKKADHTNIFITEPHMPQNDMDDTQPLSASNYNKSTSRIIRVIPYVGHENKLIEEKADAAVTSKDNIIKKPANESDLNDQPINKLSI